MIAPINTPEHLSKFAVPRAKETKEMNRGEAAAFELHKIEARNLADVRVVPEVVLAHRSSLWGAAAKEEYLLAAERYRLLCTRILHVERNRGSQVFLITSAIPEEGKTLTSMNLAFGLSDVEGKRTLLVEFDLRRPSMHRLLGLEPKPGDQSFLARGGDWRDGVLSLRKGLDVLLAMTSEDRPNELLNSGRTTTFLEQARKEYDFILIDSAPLLVAGDTHVLLPWIDHAVFVIRADSTPIECAKEAIEGLGKKMLGCVLNDVKRMKHQEYYRSYYGTGRKDA